MQLLPRGAKAPYPESMCARRRLVFVMSQTALASAQAPISTDAAHYAEFRCNASYSASPCTDHLPEALQLLSLEHVMLERPHGLPHIEMTRPGIVREQGTERIGSDAIPRTKETGVRWGRVVGQILSFTAVQHGFRLTEKKTRRELDGPWLRDWFNSASSLFIEPTWSDGGGLFTNYVSLPRLEASTHTSIDRTTHRI